MGNTLTVRESNGDLFRVKSGGRILVESGGTIEIASGALLTGLGQPVGVAAGTGVVAGAGGIADAATVLQSLGTAAVGTDNATLTSTEADWLPSNSAVLSGGIGSWATQNGSLSLQSGVSSVRDVYLNAVVADADSSASDTLTYTGTIQLVWINLGDR